MKQLNVWRAMCEKMKEYDEKIENQRHEITNLLDCKKAQHGHIKRLHRMFNELGHCYQCDEQMQSIYIHTDEGKITLAGYRCRNCNRTVYLCEQ